MGVVYTPNEVVDFIIRGTDYLLQKHFGRGLADENVQILDPATGTGTFITNLIEYLPADKLEHKYRHEMHANEVAILPYYIANLNIEYTYREKTGRYQEFPNLVFVDTLDNLGWEGATGGAVVRQGAFELGGLSFDNWYRMQGQNEKTISVILGNPPYNDSQSNWYELNPNRKYPEIDERIRETYIKEGTAQRTHQYDMYKRFIRWASDRLDDDGIIAFISNRAFLDSRQDDGFRKVVADEFNELWAVDLKGNARTSGERRRQEGGNIFDDKIRVGVAIYFLVRRRGANGFRMFYNAVEDYAKSPAKAEYIRNKAISDFEFKEVTPDSKHNWLNQSNSDFEKLIPIANRETKFAKSKDDENAIFGLFSRGVNTSRDAWVYDFSINALSDKIKYFCDIYTREIQRLERESPIDGGISQWVDRSIKWTSELENHLVRRNQIPFGPQHMVTGSYRPFTLKSTYYAPIVSHRRYQQPRIFPHEDSVKNKLICFCSNGNAFYVLATKYLPDYHFTGDSDCLPLYRYTEDGERVSNITDWGLRRINEHYRKEFGERFEEAVGGASITAEDVFAYTYAVLHDPVYRHDYRVDLLREFPRLPLYHDWDVWVKMGRELLELHIGFEDVEPYALERVDKVAPSTGSGRTVNGESPPSQPSPVEGEGVRTPRVMLRANAGDKERGEIQIDSETVLRGVPEFAWEYKLGNRTAIEWVLDQYKEKKPRDPTIRERFNTYRFADYKEDVIDLLRRVCTVSVRTAEIVGGMAYWEGEYLVVSGDRDKREWSMMGLARWFNEPDNPDDDPEYQEWLLSLPDIREQEN